MALWEQMSQVNSWKTCSRLGCLRASLWELYKSDSVPLSCGRGTKCDWNMFRACTQCKPVPVCQSRRVLIMVSKSIRVGRYGNLIKPPRLNRRPLLSHLSQGSGEASLPGNLPICYSVCCCLAKGEQSLSGPGCFS